MATHPPIPRNSRNSKLYADGTADLFNDAGNRLYCTCHGDQYRRIIAAVYEVEWRKRAERWMRIETKYHPVGTLGRANYFRWKWASTKSLEAFKNAVLWRAWGEGK
jgi:hypothetical protein